MIHNYTSKNFYFPDMSALAKLIELNYDKREVLFQFLNENLKKYKSIEAIVIGCTHYNFVIPELQKIFPNAHIFSNIEGVVKRTKYIINKNNFSTARENKNFCLYNYVSFPQLYLILLWQELQAKVYFRLI